MSHVLKLNLSVLGVGLIGGSFALALKEAGFSGVITGYDLNADGLLRAQQLGVIDRIATDPQSAVAEADLVMLAVPMLAMRPLLKAIGVHLPPQAVVTDVGSVKGSFVAAAKEILGNLRHVVPGHPIAGTERSGVEAAFSSLFRGRRVILTPHAETAPAAVSQVRQLWECAGASVETLAIDHHDRILAETSHLPHILAYSLVDALARLPEHTEIFKYAAGGFRDFTRIASSDPTMWRDVCLTNRAALLAVLDRYRQDLDHLIRLIDEGDGQGLFDIFQRAKQARDRHCA